MKPMITRIAPSPTGFAHFGNFRTAYFNWLAARATKGKFFVRIDDTDLNRNDPDAVKVIFDTLKWLNLDYDYTFTQSSRSANYEATYSLLIANDLAYYDEGCIRLKLPIDLPEFWTDTIAGDIKINDNDRKLIDGLVIRKSDGTPTYHFASACDDVDCSITNIIRGTDHISNTPKQIAIMLAINKIMAFNESWALPSFTHVGLINIINSEGKKVKLSKRDNAASLLTYRDLGIVPSAMLNTMLRLGWSPSDPNFDKNNKTIPADKAIEMFFNEGSMRSASSLFDSKILDLYNRRYTTIERL